MSAASAASAASAGDLLPPAISDSDSENSSSIISNNSSDESTSLPPKSSLEDSIFAAYLQIHGSKSTSLLKIRSFLSSAAGRNHHSLSCLICLGRIRPSDPTWSCSSGCHVILHLHCLQSWASQSSYHCPKCRLPYPPQTFPKSYLCFCGKRKDPPLDPWILPHSCGEICGRALAANCGHTCLLLCHPGACPPCPMQITAPCFCGSRTDSRRCEQKDFSCNRPCAKLLACRIHRCVDVCHEGPCPPCRVEGLHNCACGKVVEERVCAEREFRCEGSCDGVLLCGKHGCRRGCHCGPCGDCALRGRRSCPCGKREYKGVSCDEDVATCGLTCEKVLGCGFHRCPERCHRGACAETCRIVGLKACRCGSLKKEVMVTIFVFL